VNIVAQSAAKRNPASPTFHTFWFTSGPPPAKIETKEAVLSDGSTFFFIQNSAGGFSVCRQSGLLFAR
jgi:hypothetical protein